MRRSQKVEITNLERRHLSDAEKIYYPCETGRLSGLRRAISQVSMMVVKVTTSGEAAWREELLKYRQTKFSSRRIRKRVVFKHGDCNVVQGNVAKRRRRYLQDIFTTLVDAQWRWTLLVFSMNFLLSWLAFALIWWLIAYSHGDLEPQNYNNNTFIPCVVDIRNFASCFLFSVETQHTIGYGAKHTTDECPEAIFTLCIQSMTGVILQAFMVGIVFAKLSRPKKRTQTLLFSRNAVICQRDDQPCLMFRVGDMRKSHIIEAHVRAQMIKRKVTKEGELLPFFQTELKVGGDGEEDKIFFIWPTTIVHKIDRYSPLYKVSASDMLRERFEIVVILEGVIESTGMTTQARSSYLPSEILWGHRFQPIITFRKETGEYEVNYTLFNNTYEVDTPLCSAADLDRIRAMHRVQPERLSSSRFPEYHETYSSSSLTMTSASSLRSSTGELHMQVPAMSSTSPLNPISVIITRSNSCKQESINHPDISLPSSFAQNEVTKEERNIKTSKNEEDYDHALKNINASLMKSRNEKEDRNELKTKLHLTRNEDTKSKSKSAVKETQESDLKRSPCESNEDIRRKNTANSSEYFVMPRKSSVSSDDHKLKNISKKTNFIVNEEALITDPNSQNISLSEQT